MIIQTLFFGELEIEEEKIINFANGIPGLETLTKYVYLELEENAPFSYLQSVENAHISFLVTSPFTFFSDFDFEIPESVMEELGIQDESEVSVFSIVSVNEKKAEITLNLLAPVVINNRAHVGKQIILYNSEYKSKHRIEWNSASLSQESEGGVSC